jgi:hypothetical protein
MLQPVGSAERCTGDPARRSGDDYLFQMLTTTNVEMFATIHVTKIVVPTGTAAEPAAHTCGWKRPAPTSTSTAPRS